MTAAQLSKASVHGKVVPFWTPNYWYRPRAACNAYREIRCHLDRLTDYVVELGRPEGRRIFSGGRKRRAEVGQVLRLLFRVFPYLARLLFSDYVRLTLVVADIIVHSIRQRQAGDGSTTAYLRALLRLDYRVGLADVDAASLAAQLTLVDRELFARLRPGAELASCAAQRSSRDAPNLGAWIAFAHRISCLVASEILRGDGQGRSDAFTSSVETRALLIARLLDAAERCFAIGNFQSARSILAGLQSPAIYRLTITFHL